MVLVPYPAPGCCLQAFLREACSRQTKTKTPFGPRWLLRWDIASWRLVISVLSFPRRSFSFLPLQGFERATVRAAQNEAPPI